MSEEKESLERAKDLIAEEVNLFTLFTAVSEEEYSLLEKEDSLTEKDDCGLVVHLNPYKVKKVHPHEIISIVHRNNRVVESLGTKGYSCKLNFDKDDQIGIRINLPRDKFERLQSSVNSRCLEFPEGLKSDIMEALKFPTFVKEKEELKDNQLDGHLPGLVYEYFLLSNYQDIVEFSEGGMRKVYKANIGGTDSEIAIKVDKFPSTEKTKKLFGKGYTNYNELEILKSIKDPSGHNLTGLYNFVNLEKFGYSGVITIENFFKGSENLETRIKGKETMNIKFSDKEIGSIFSQLVNAVKYLNSDAGIYHRDIKPSNVLIKGEGKNLELRVTDFANSRKVEDVKKEGKKFDSTEGGRDTLDPFLHFSEEPAQYDHKSEIYSIGATMYYAITGKHLFRSEPHERKAYLREGSKSILDKNKGTINEEYYEKILKNELKRVPDKYRFIIHRCVASRDKRYSSLSELEGDLQYVMNLGSFVKKAIATVAGIIIIGGLTWYGVSKNYELDSAKWELKSAKNELHSTKNELNTVNGNLQSTEEDLRSKNQELWLNRSKLRSKNQELWLNKHELDLKEWELGFVSDRLYGVEEKLYSKEHELHMNNSELRSKATIEKEKFRRRNNELKSENEHLKEKIKSARDLFISDYGSVGLLSMKNINCIRRHVSVLLDEFSNDTLTTLSYLYDPKTTRRIIGKVGSLYFGDIADELKDEDPFLYEHILGTFRSFTFNHTLHATNKFDQEEVRNLFLKEIIPIVDRAKSSPAKYRYHVTFDRELMKWEANSQK